MTYLFIFRLEIGLHIKTIISAKREKTIELIL